MIIKRVKADIEQISRIKGMKFTDGAESKVRTIYLFSEFIRRLYFQQGVHHQANQSFGQYWKSNYMRDLQHILFNNREHIPPELVKAHCEILGQVPEGKLMINFPHKLYVSYLAEEMLRRFDELTPSLRGALPKLHFLTEL